VLATLGAFATRERPARADVVLTLVDFGFAVSRPLSPGRRAILVRNEGRQPHRLLIARLRPGRSAADVQAWLTNRQGVPPFDAVAGTDPLVVGASHRVTADLAPGDYVLACLLRDVKDGRPHLAYGMVRPLRVR
jgi:hypothetical protein